METSPIHDGWWATQHVLTFSLGRRDSALHFHVTMPHLPKSYHGQDTKMWAVPDMSWFTLMGLASSMQDPEGQMNFPPSPQEKWRVWAAEKQWTLTSVGRDIWKQRCCCTASHGCMHAFSTQVEKKSKRLTLNNPVPRPDVVSRHRIDD